MQQSTAKIGRVSRRPGALLARRGAAFVVSAGIVVELALKGGGYDIVTREQLGIVIWAVIGLGFAFGFLPRGRLSGGAWVALGSIAALAALTALALAWTKSDERTFAELARVLAYAGLITLAFTALHRETWRAAAGGLAAAALFIPLLSLVSRLAPGVIADHTAHQLHLDRLSYPLGYWNAVAAWGAIAISVGLAWSAHARHTLTRALALAAVPAAGLTVYLTYSRGGAIATVIAVIVAIALARNRWTVATHALVAAAGTGLAVLAVRNHHEIARATGGGGGGAVLVVLLLAAAMCAVVAATSRIGGLDRIRLSPRAGRVAAVLIVFVAADAALLAHHPLSRVWNQFRHERTVAVGADPTSRLSGFGGNRYQVWKTAVEAFDSQPLRGIGPGTFEFYWAQHGSDAEFLRNAHSLYLESLAELGVPGLLAVAALLGALLWAGIRARRSLQDDAESGASAALIGGFVVFVIYAAGDWIWQFPAIVALAVGGAAVAAAASFQRRGPRPFAAGPRLALVVVAAMAAATQVPGLISTQRIRSSVDSLNSGNIDHAHELADQAVRIEPWAASPYVQRATVEDRRGDRAAAISDLKKAVDKEPTNWRHHFGLAQIYAEEGNRAAVVSELAQVRRLAPRTVFLIPGAQGRGQIDPTLGLAPSPATRG